MNSDCRLIGLVGGVGPWAGLDVHRKILEESSYACEQECVSVMHLSFPGKYTDRTDFLLGRTDVNPAYEFIRELGFLEEAGVNSAAIVCNTAHAQPILDVIASGIQHLSLHYINIIRETQLQLELDGVRRVGLLATLGTYSLELYNNGFKGEIIHPDEQGQQRVHDVIYNPQNGLKVHYPHHTEELYHELAAVAQTLIDQGAEALVLGCTELPLLSDFSRYVDVPVYDPNRILAKALVRSSLESKIPEPLAVGTEQPFIV